MLLARTTPKTYTAKGQFWETAAKRGRCMTATGEEGALTDHGSPGVVELLFCLCLARSPRMMPAESLGSVPMRGRERETEGSPKTQKSLKESEVC